MVSSGDGRNDGPEMPPRRIDPGDWKDLDTLLDELAIECFEQSKAKGFYDDLDPNDPRHIVSVLALIITEISEAIEAVRRNPDAPCDKPGVDLTALEEEWADAVIRLFDFAGLMGISPARVIMIKHAYNRTRGLRHGGKRC